MDNIENTVLENVEFENHEINNVDTKNKKIKKGYRITSLVCGIVSLFVTCSNLAFISGALAIIFGIISLCQKQPKAMPIWGIVLGGIGIVGFLVCKFWIFLFIGPFALMF